MTGILTYFAAEKTKAWAVENGGQMEWELASLKNEELQRHLGPN